MTIIHNEYRRSRWGCDLVYRYPIVKIVDYREKLDELEISDDPFAIIVSAYLHTLESGKNNQQKFTWKKHFLTELYQHGMDRETLQAVYKFIDWIMDLPEELETEIFEEIKTIEEVKKMSVLTTAERIGMEKGMLPAYKAIDTIVEIKFGEAGKVLAKRASSIKKLPLLEVLIDELKTARDISEASLAFDRIEAQARISNGKNGK